MKTKIFFLLFFLGIIALVFYFKSLDKNLYQPIAKENSCVSCHIDMKGFSPSHISSKVLCNDCHLGNPNSFDKFEAHHNMVLIPGNLSNVSETCAKCHKGIDHRVKNSLMNTMSGIISVDKFVFDENKNLDSLFNIHHLTNKTAADNHLRNKCASCHIGNEKLKTHPITQQSRGGGCTACHLNYADGAKNAHQTYINSKKEELPKIHPSISLKITDNHCFGCHSRSGRIATNYEGWHETLFKDTLYQNKNYRVLADKRVFKKQNEDIHHTNGLSCIDCHDSYDVMGDGNSYAHQENAVNTSCKDCHIKSNQKINDLSFLPFQELNQDEKRIIRLRQMDTTKQFLHSNITNKNIINVFKNNDNLTLETKNTAKKINLNKQSTSCTNSNHKNISCSACHTSWSPQCISCHTQFDNKEDGYDLLKKEWHIGKWQEKGDLYLAEYPSLGVVTKNNKKTIKTFSPGMIMHLQQNDSTKAFHRLFAPTSAHTIAKKGRTCKECHNNSVVLGYGRGDLTYKNTQWFFKPKFSKEQDGLPLDAWIGFLSNDTLNKTTRKNARPFNVAEQKRILKVGACLTCHKENSAVVKQITTDYSKALKDRQASCYN